MKKKLIFLCSAILIVSLISGCSLTKDQLAQGGSKSSVRTVTDMAGNQVEIPNEIKTYGDAWGAHNTVSIMLDGAKRMTSTMIDQNSSKWSAFYQIVPSLKDIPTVFTSTTDVNIEELIKVKPDVVFTTGSGIGEKLKTIGVPAIDCTFKDFEGMKKSVELTGQVLGGDSEEKEKKYISYLDDKIQMIKDKTANLKNDQKPTVLHIYELDGLKVDGNNTIINEWIEMAGGKNAAAEISGNTVSVDFEQILKWNPDYIIVGAENNDLNTIYKDKKWSALKAVQNGHVYENPEGVFSWDRYGVEEALQVQWVAQLLHPEIFDIDLEKELDYFYSEIIPYNYPENQKTVVMKAKK